MLSADKQLPEGSVPQRLGEGPGALGQDLAAVGDEQQRQVAVAFAQPLVVEGGDDRLAGAGCGHHEVAGPAVSLTFDVQRPEDLLLVGPRTQLEAGEVDGDRPARGLLHREGEPVGVTFGVVGLELVRRPRLEGRGELVEQLRRAVRGQADVPLEAVEQRRARQVRRAHVPGREAGPAVEQPRLRMQPGGLGVVADLDLGAEHGQLVERPALGGAHVGRGDDAQAAAAPDEVGEGLSEDPEAGPGDERAQQVDGVSAGQLATDL